jgi:hypothetical protein
MMSAFTWICPECGEDNYCEVDAIVLVCGECGEEVERVIDAADIAAKVEASSLGTPEAKALRATVSDEHAARIVARAKELDTSVPAPAADGGEVAGVLAAHSPRTQPPMGLVVGCSCGWRIGRTMYEGYDTHVADVLAPLLADLRRTERAEGAREALLAAADAWTQGAWSNVMLPEPPPPAVPVIAYSNRMGDWLRSRAASGAGQ